MVRERSELLDRLDATHGHGDRHAAARAVPDPRRVDVEVVAAVGDQLAGLQLADDLHGLAQHDLTRVDTWPAVTDYVLVEVLTGTESEYGAAETRMGW